MPLDRPRALIVYSRVGGGHLAAARAIAEALEATGRLGARLADAYVDYGRFPVTQFPRIYARLARYHPRLWSLVYHASARGVRPDAVLGRFVRPGLRRLMETQRPTVVVSVLPAINELLVEASGHVGARVEVVLTDWHLVHKLWVGEGVDHYTTPTESARLDCIRFGASPSVVDVVGIPVQRPFTECSQVLARHRTFTILAMVGAEGSPRAMRNMTALARAELDAQLVVVCGRNQEMRRRLERIRARMPMRVLGFVDDMAALMRSADLLITKAGGLTLAEAYCCELPVVIHDVLPGQEAGNLEYVRRAGAAEHSSNPRELVRIVSGLATDPVRRARLAESGARLARPHAAAQIAANILARL